MQAASDDRIFHSDRPQPGPDEHDHNSGHQPLLPVIKRCQLHEVGFRRQ